MKKAKLMLTAIAVVAIVGGAFALKAKTNATLFVPDAPGSSSCTTTGPRVNSNGIDIQNVSATFVSGACGVVTYSLTED